MAKSFNELRARMSPERRARNEAGTKTILRELRLNELRRAFQLSQEQIAELLQVKQSTVSKMEHNTDILISTLRRYLDAMGVRLVIRAEFPDGEEVEITQFQDLSPLSDDDEERERAAA